ncbi:Multidrug resistance protein MdtA precursor [Planctomycetes bacterium Pan216]|uniref:Multidrug resistance protein MdtA n=1 Tax=Kolteria novifilia TaxID=2527975 RepID=A0A518BCT2_9BACT|nr:Multidrug resistance protein MdtA precursor [Planctomycetes bacterium Pan216]
MRRSTPLASWIALLTAASSLFAQGGGPTPVNVALARTIEQEATVTVVGDVEPLRRALVASKEEGAVIEFPFREGDAVKKGDVLARLETTVLEHELATAQAMLEARKQEYDELNNGTRSEVIAAAKARMEAAKAVASLAQSKLERTRKLKLSASVEELDEARAEADRAKQMVAEFEAAHEEATNGPRAEQVERAKAMVAAQESEIKRLESLIDRHVIKAPFDGYVTKEQTQVGEWVTRGGPVVEIIDLEEVDVRVPVPGRYIGKVKLGQQVHVSFDSIKDRLLEGTVRQIVPEADRKSRLFPVMVRMKNFRDGETPGLRAGMLARVDLPAGDVSEGVFVPKDALVLGEAVPMVFVVKPMPSQADGAPGGLTVAPAVIRLGATVGNLIEVRGDVKPGDRVVIEGNERLRPGQPVSVLEAPSKS